MKKYILLVVATIVLSSMVGQNDSVPKVRQKKNVIRYNLSGAMLFGWSNFIIVGYERVIWKNHSMSVNGGTVKFPQLIYISNNLFDMQKDESHTGYNFSIDYRYYPLKDNKHPAPRGVYIGPYYSYNKFIRDNEWRFRNNSYRTYFTTHSELIINTFGFQLGYQFILWKRLALDFIAVGPGCGVYQFESKVDVNLSTEERSALVETLKDLVIQKFPGADFVFSEKQLNASGVTKTTSIGYRYMIHVGFNF